MNSRLPELVESRIEFHLPEIIKLRHSLHGSPEKGMDLPSTSARVRDELVGMGLQLWDPILGSDVVADLACAGDRTILLRADMDALPIHEATGLEYASRNPGLMHACGHDGHAAILVGTARVLSDLRGMLPSTVRFVFQPGEEVCGGGKLLVERGVCDGCESAFALHGWPGIPIGAVSTRPGPLFAAGLDFSITVEGIGCHGAMPELGCNPIPVASRIVGALERYHREISGQGDVVVSVCTFHSGASTNVIPGAAAIEGTSRYLEAGIGKRVQCEIRRIAEEIAGDAGVGVSVELREVYDIPVANSQRGYEAVRRVAEECLPAGAWIEAECPSMGMEDFAFYLRGREGAMFRLGLGESHPPLHTPTFDFEDQVISTGILMLAMLALTY